MSIVFHQEWQHLSTEEQHALMNATEGYISFILPSTMSDTMIPALREQKKQVLTEQYLRGEVTLEGLDYMSDPHYWQYIEPFHSSSTILPFTRPLHIHLDHLLADIRSPSWNHTAYESSDYHISVPQPIKSNAIMAR
ncbi:MAG: hypothetical protein EAY65_04030 [Alphaproteobacteria bacterium]|nr:MAG: hypothetical protein EAY65_04030 [Alphaproteobacteria bacterium]